MTSGGLIGQSVNVEGNCALAGDSNIGAGTEIIPV